jgi:hypothetical protein
MNKAKIAITVILILGLMALLVLMAFFQVWVFVNDLLYWSHGTIFLLAFMVSAFIFGGCLHKVANRIRILWKG